MKKFEAKTLEEAYELAAHDFGCSVTEILFEVIQQPSRGFLGFGKKNAIVMAVSNYKIEKQKSYQNKDNRFKKQIEIKDFQSNIADEIVEETVVVEQPVKVKYDFTNDPKIEKKETIFENFYDHETQGEFATIKIKKDKNEIIAEVHTKLDELFSNFCYKLNPIKVDFHDDETLYIEFSGEDSALLIGKEGYRYKALSYILFNWINEKYGLMIRLEVAEFLKNQEEAIFNYLTPVIEQIQQNGSSKTKSLDGVLVHIALKKLRETFPEKYVAVKTNIKGEKYILVNEYKQS